MRENRLPKQIVFSQLEHDTPPWCTAAEEIQGHAEAQCEGVQYQFEGT